MLKTVRVLKIEDRENIANRFFNAYRDCLTISTIHNQSFYVNKTGNIVDLDINNGSTVIKSQP